MFASRGYYEKFQFVFIVSQMIYVLSDGSFIRNRTEASGNASWRSVFRVSFAPIDVTVCCMSCFRHSQSSTRVLLSSA